MNARNQGRRAVLVRALGAMGASVNGELFEALAATDARARSEILDDLHALELAGAVRRRGRAWELAAEPEIAHDEPELLARSVIAAEVALEAAHRAWCEAQRQPSALSLRVGARAELLNAQASYRAIEERARRRGVTDELVRAAREHVTSAGTRTKSAVRP